MEGESGPHIPEEDESPFLKENNELLREGNFSPGNLSLEANDTATGVKMKGEMTNNKTKTEKMEATTESAGNGRFNDKGEFWDCGSLEFDMVTNQTNTTEKIAKETNQDSKHMDSNVAGQRQGIISVQKTIITEKTLPSNTTTNFEVNSIGLVHK